MSVMTLWEMLAMMLLAAYALLASIR